VDPTAGSGTFLLDAIRELEKFRQTIESMRNELAGAVGKIEELERTKEGGQSEVPTGDESPGSLEKPR
jgi:hypothetical protein